MGAFCSTGANALIDPNQVNCSHFTMMKVVGKGGFGKVNAVTHRSSGKILAMKRLKKHMLISREACLETAWVERTIMSKLNNPFVLHILYAFQDPEELYLIMPFCAGGDLRYYLNNQPRMTEDVCRFYMSELLIGLEHLHSLHIVYRDLKPDNLLLDGDGHLCISDFGLAYMLKEEDNYQTRGADGTAGYRAPEALQNGKYGTEVDVFSFGVTMYECLERRLPWKKEDHLLQGQKIELSSKLSPECKDLLTRLLAFKKSDRIGCGSDGWDEIKDHEWFKSTNWEEVKTRSIKPPHKPDTERANCPTEHEAHEVFFGDEDDAPKLTIEQQKKFEGFDYNTQVTVTVTATAEQGHEAK